MVQVLTGILKAMLLACVATIAWAAAHKARATEPTFTLRPGWHIFQVVAGSALLVALAATFAGWLYRVSVSRRLRLVWTPRRRREAAAAALKATVMAVSLATFIAGNAIVLARPEAFCRTPAALTALSSVRWVGWSTLVLVLLVDAHGCVLHPTPARPRGLVQDLPLAFHWRKLLLWAALVGAWVARATGALASVPVR